MRSTGIVRKVDDLGRVVMPIELRRTMNIAEGDGMEIFIDGDKIILRKYQPGCSCCGSINTLREFGNIKLCQICEAQIKSA